ncbi:hypothetical protein PINS_up008938 [Pythium insidiosum]|nr:hypothetical protein PINS_up008938 [Pythium insidiosum]
MPVSPKRQPPVPSPTAIPPAVTAPAASKTRRSRSSIAPIERTKVRARDDRQRAVVSPAASRVGSPFTTFQRASVAPTLSSTAATAAAPLSHHQPLLPTTAASSWRPTPTTDAVASFQLGTSDPMIWRYALPTGVERLTRHRPQPSGLSPPSSISYQQEAQRRRRRWTHDRVLGSSEAVADVLAFLACGLCGDLVNDNRQCGAQLLAGMRCPQLFCASCLARATSLHGAASALDCCKCGQPLDPKTMQCNELAQAQAGTLGLATRGQQEQDDAARRVSLDEMTRLVHAAVEEAAAVDLHAFFLAPQPAHTLAELSVAQLDVLEDVHRVALRQIAETKLELARAQERLRVEEWLRTQRAIFSFAPLSTAPPS